VRFHILMVISMKVAVFCDVVPCSLLHHQDSGDDDHHADDGGSKLL
jgi:hypothetical protein